MTIVASFDPAAPARWIGRTLRRSGATLKAEYEAGREGDDSPVAPIYGGPKQQLDAVLAALRTKRPDEPPAPVDDADVDAAAEALRAVDWQQVRAAAMSSASGTADAMRTMAARVDWAKAQPVAAQVSSALIAAVAAGRIPVGGRLGPVVAQALGDSGVLSQRIGERLEDEHAPLPPDFRDVIDTTATP